MAFFRNIIAALLALVIASPLCCCAMTRMHEGKVPSCCSMAGGGKSPAKSPAACLCAAKQPKDLSKEILVPTDRAVALEPPVFEIPVPDPSPRSEMLPSALPEVFCDPPGHFLAMYSRWLI